MSEHVDENLSGLDFTAADLSFNNYTGADLSGAILAGTTLTNTSFRGADLTGADLTDASTGNTDFSNANLTHADLTNVNLAACNTDGAVFDFAILDGATTTGIDPARFLVQFGVTARTVAEGDDARFIDSRAPTAHAVTHQNGSVDEISVAGLSGLLADPQTPLTGVLASTDLTNDAALEKTANKAAASGYASLDGSSKVVQDPANATATPTASKIPVADASAKLDGWVTRPKAYSNTSVPGGNTVGNTVDETTFSSSYTIPANSLAVGDVIRVTAHITYAMDGVNCMLALKCGGQVCVLAGTTDSAGESAWITIQADLLVLAIGASGSLDTQSGSLAGGLPTVDTTGTLAITMTADKDSAAAGNDVTLRQLIVEVLKG
jgi:hypothetical protein